MSYTIGEISQITGITASALRYYDRQGLLPQMERSDGNIRRFSEQDLQWLNMIECLKSTGMQLKDIKQFFVWCQQGDATIRQRYEMFLERRADTQRQIAQLQKSLDRINFKCEYYRRALEAGTTDLPELQVSYTEGADITQLFRDAVGVEK